jgi:hypothetical protein
MPDRKSNRRITAALTGIGRIAAITFAQTTAEDRLRAICWIGQ